MTSPKILFIEWGSIELNNPSGSGTIKGKDYKLYPGGSRAWDWGETGTRHKPGIQRGDVEELIENGCTHIVLSRGMEEKLGVPEETIQWLEGKRLKVHVAETRKAVEIYNRLVQEGESVGGLIHSTC
jgi:hypothetical protein